MDWSIGDRGGIESGQWFKSDAESHRWLAQKKVVGHFLLGDDFGKIWPPFIQILYITYVCVCVCVCVCIKRASLAPQRIWRPRRMNLICRLTAGRYFGPGRNGRPKLGPFQSIGRNLTRIRPSGRPNVQRRLFLMDARQCPCVQSGPALARRPILNVESNLISKWYLFLF